MTNPTFISEQVTTITAAPILIVDRAGDIGIGLYEKIKKELPTVLVSSEEPATSMNLVYIPFKRIPEIPEEKYSLIVYVVDSQTEFVDLAPGLLKKADQEKIKCVFITDMHIINAQIFYHSISENNNAYAIILGNIFGQKLQNKNLSSLDKILYKAGLTGIMQLADMGLREMQPVYYPDIISHILQSIFGIHEQTKVSLLFPKHTVTELMVAHAIQKIDPLVHIDFLSNSKKHLMQKQETTLWEGTYLLPEDYPVLEKTKLFYKKIVALRQQQSDSYTPPEQLFTEEKKASSEKQKNKNWFIVGLSLFFGLLSMLLLPIILFLTAGVIGRQTIENAKADLEKGSITSTKQNSQIAEKSFSFAQHTEPIVGYELGLIGQKKIIDDLGYHIETGRLISGTFLKGVTAIENFKQILEGKSINPQTDFITATDALRHSIINLQMLEFRSDIPSDYKAKLQKINKDIARFAGILPVLPQLMGMDKQKTYLVLFQNNMELRPGGGFIGSYGLIDIDKGKPGELSVHDVYDADGQLKEHIEPPFAIRRYMPLVHLYMRDSNFDVDFAGNGVSVSNLLKHETGKNVDGIIAIDLSYVKTILSAIGSVYVPQYNETVTADNFFLLTEKHAEKNFFPGSSQKKDFLKDLFIALQNKLKTDKHIAYQTLFANTVNAMKQKHMLFSLTDSALQNLSIVNGFSSSLWDARQEGNGNINDFLGINEANLGVNKSNYFLQRSMKQEMQLDSAGVLSGKVTVTYKNTSKKDQWPGGDYKNYVRFVLPQTAALTEIDIDGQKQKLANAVTDPLFYEEKGFRPPPGIEVEKSIEQKKTLYGFLITVPAGATKQVRVQYQFTQGIDLRNPILHYDLKLFKQPGTDADPFALVFTYPDIYKAINASQNVTSGTGVSSYVTSLATDQEVYVNLGKK